MKNKSIVVYASKSFVREDTDDGSERLVTYLEPVAVKRLDFKYHKSIEAVVQQQNFEIQDSYY